MNTYEKKENMSKDHIYSHKYGEGGSFYNYLGGNSNYTDIEMRRNIVDKVLGPDYTAYIMFDEKAPKGQYDEMKKKYAANSDSWQVIWRSSSYQSEARLSPDKNVIKANVFSNYGIVGAIYVKNQTSPKKFSSGGPIMQNYSSPLIHEGIQSVISKFDLGGVAESALTQAYRASGSPIYSFGGGGELPNHSKSEENIEKGNYEMMLSQLKETMHHSEELSKILKSEKHIEAWVVSKMEVVTQTLSDITHYLDGKTEYAQGGKIKTPGLATVKIENADVNFDRDHYKGIFEDIDLDGIPNADDPEPQKPGDTKSVEQVEFTKVFDKVIDTKKGLDKELDIFIQKLRDYAPENSAIYARTKTPYSIFNKLVDTRLLDEKKGLKDLVGTTIAFDDLEDLKKANKLAKKGFFGKVLDFDDFYENPNHGYRAYHYIIDQDGVPIELQLKTTRMKDVNILSHEPYKQKKLNETYNDYVTLLAHQADMGAPDAIVAYNNLMKDKETVSKKLFKNNPN